LGVGRRQLREMIAVGRIKCVTLNGRPRITKTALEHFAAGLTPYNGGATCNALLPTAKRRRHR